LTTLTSLSEQWKDENAKELSLFLYFSVQFAGWQTFKLGKFKIGELQPLPKNGKFVTDRRYWKSQNEAFVTIAEEFAEEIGKLSGELP
jgi:hypothetical protein